MALHAGEPAGQGGHDSEASPKPRISRAHIVKTLVELPIASAQLGRDDRGHDFEPRKSRVLKLGLVVSQLRNADQPQCHGLGPSELQQS